MMDARLLVVPQQRPQTVPVLGIPVQVHHGIEHPWLDGLAALIEEPHNGTPAQSGKDRELARVGGDRLYSG